MHKPGDNVKIRKGPYKGMSGKLRSRVTETDTNTDKRRAAWTVWINNVVELVYEDEIGGRK